MGWMKKSLLPAAAALAALGSVAPAAASPHGHGRGHHGGHHGHHKFHGHHGYYGHHGGFYYGSHGYRRHHHKHGLSGGEAALLAAGIIGGVILIDRALENERRYDRYAYRRPYPDDRYDDRYPNDRYRYERDGYGRYYDDRDDGLDDELLGGPEDSGYSEGALSGGRGEYNYGAAYNDCKAETREAARQAGVIVALPAKPERIAPIDDGYAVRFETSYLASDSGREWRRTMVCEADKGGVRFLELV
jgi:hypothetical protein